MSEVFVSPATVSKWENGSTNRPVWLDCRSRLGQPGQGRELFEKQHIAGAQFADLETDLANLELGKGRHPLPHVEDFAAACQSWGIGSQPVVPVVVYDDMYGAMAARAWWMLRWIGLSEVYILDGGFGAWCDAGGTLESVVSKTPSHGDASLVTAVGGMPVTTMGAIKEMVSTNEPNHLLLDARASERYSGEVEPIDRVAGHVPGAANRPFGDSLVDGRLMAESNLLKSWQQTLGSVSPEKVIHMCGSGVTACFNLACMEHLGLTGSSLFIDSWSGWVSDPENPVSVSD